MCIVTRCFLDSISNTSELQKLYIFKNRVTYFYPEANIWAQEGREWGVEKAPQ